MGGWQSRARDSWRGRHVLTTAGWSEPQLAPLFDLAELYQQYTAEGIGLRTTSPINLLTLFFEPSTRTRLSFESAAHRLGINILAVPDASTSSSSKGETLADTARIVSAYADAVVLRHPRIGSAGEFASAAAVPVINAGDGAGEHPTQSLVDLFTIRAAFGGLAGLRVGICGDLKHGRTVHSLLRLLLAHGCQVVAVAPDELALRHADTAGSADSLRSTTDLRAVLPDLDVLYMTRVQRERFADPAEYERVQGVYRLTVEDLELAPSHLRVLHPLPRVDEIAEEVDDMPQALYFRQAANGVPTRMALLAAVLGPERFVVTEPGSGMAA
jgi:aspartate carbamoyltransferase catalytic subunit